MTLNFVYPNDNNKIAYGQDRSTTEVNKFLQNIFSVPIYSVNIRDTVDIDLFVRKVKELPMKEFKSNQHIKDRYVSTFEDKTPLLDRDFCVDLKKEINNHIEQLSSYLRIKTPELANSWANIINKDYFIGAHAHHGSIFSGAFYPNSTDESASLVFNNPFNSIENEYAYKDLPRLWEKFHGIKPETGLLILFPSYLNHLTGKNNMDNRITVSFNTIYHSIVSNKWEFYAKTVKGVNA